MPPRFLHRGRARGRCPLGCRICDRLDLSQTGLDFSLDSAIEKGSFWGLYGDLKAQVVFQLSGCIYSRSCSQSIGLVFYSLSEFYLTFVDI